MELDTKQNVIILKIYPPPDFSPIVFNKKLYYLLKMLHRENETIFITGDFNIEFSVFNTSDAITNPNINVTIFKTCFYSMSIHP